MDYKYFIISVLSVFSVAFETFYLYLCYTFFGGMAIMQLSEAIRKRILELMKENNIKTINAVTTSATNVIPFCFLMFTFIFLPPFCFSFISTFISSFVQFYIYFL